MDFKFNLGDQVEDNITQFNGIIVCRTQWLHNCNTYGVRSKELKDGAPVDLQYFDEPQLKCVLAEEFESSRETGGPEKAVQQTNR